MSAYHPHHAFAAPAQLKSDLPRLIIGFALIEIIFNLTLGVVHDLLARAPISALDTAHLNDSRGALLVQLFSFILLALSALFVVRWLHDRPMHTLIGPPAQAWRDLLHVTGVGIAALALIEVLPPYYSFAGAVWNAPFLWLTTLPLAMIALLIQTSAEELVYRGYLQQQIAARFPHPLVWLILPNLLFAAAHWNSTIGRGDAQIYVIWAFFFGLAASDLTARSGTIGAAIGFHLANNAFAFLIFGTRDAANSDLALILFPAPDTAAETLLPPSAQGDGFELSRLVIELLILGILWLVARIAIKR